MTAASRPLRLTKSQRAALELLYDRGAAGVYSSTENGPPGSSYAASGSLIKLEELGLAEAHYRGRLLLVDRHTITAAGRALVEFERADA